MYEDIYLDLLMVFPNSTLVGVHTRDYSTEDKILPGILPSEEVKKDHY